MRKISIKYVLAAGLALQGYAVPALAADAAAVPEQQSENGVNFPAINVTSAETRELTDKLVATGSVQPVEEVYVQPQVDGLRIESLSADIGDLVKAGEVVAKLSQDSLILQKSQLEANRAKAVAVGAQLKAQLAEVDANAKEAERQAARSESLVERGAVAKSQAEQLRATAVAARARVNSAQQAIEANVADVNVVDAQIRDIDLKLARTDVKTPVSGMVTARNAKIGAIAAGAGTPLLTVMRDNAVEMQADVTEGDLLRVKPGQKVKIVLAGGATTVDGTVRVVEPVVDQTTRLGTVNISIDDADKARPGMYASAEIIISKRSVLSLPLTAITSQKDGAFVRKVSDGKVHLQKVTTGVQDGNYLEIVDGLSAGDMVVEKAGAYVRDGDRVNPVVSDKTASN